MAIEEHFSNREINIRRLSLNVAGRKQEDFISDEDGRLIEKYLEEIGIGVFPSMLMKAKILSPERFESITFSEEQIKFAMENNARGPRGYCEVAAEFKIGDYKTFARLSEFRERMAEKLVERINKMLEEDSVDWKEYVYSSAHLAIISPENVKNIVFPRPVVRQGIRNLLEFRRGKFEMVPNATDLVEHSVEFASIAAYFRIAFPEKFPDIKPDSSAMQELQDKLQKFRKEKNWYAFLSLASAMKILTAEDVKVNDDGLEIIMPGKKSVGDKADLPAKKKF